jgi:hypothetical protein
MCPVFSPTCSRAHQSYECHRCTIKPCRKASLLTEILKIVSHRLSSLARWCYRWYYLTVLFGNVNIYLIYIKHSLLVRYTHILWWCWCVVDDDDDNDDDDDDDDDDYGDDDQYYISQRLHRWSTLLWYTHILNTMMMKETRVHRENQREDIDRQRTHTSIHIHYLKSSQLSTTGYKPTQAKCVKHHGLTTTPLLSVTVYLPVVYWLYSHVSHRNSNIGQGNNNQYQPIRCYDLCEIRLNRWCVHPPQHFVLR